MNLYLLFVSLAWLLLQLLSAGGCDGQESDSCSAAGSASSCEQEAPSQSHLYSVEANSWQRYLDLIEQAKVGHLILIYT
jgi:hypothetical protein